MVNKLISQKIWSLSVRVADSTAGTWNQSGIPAGSRYHVEYYHLSKLPRSNCLIDLQEHLDYPTITIPVTARCRQCCWRQRIYFRCAMNISL